MAPTLFRPAAKGDTPRILAIIRQAQAQMRAAGSRQWQDGYPAPSHIDADIARGAGYVLCKSGSTEVPRQTEQLVIAYGAVVFDGEPAYAHIDGRWRTQAPYVVVHRLAVADGEKGRGVAAEFLRQTEDMASQRGMRSFRIDTNFDNRPMLRLLERQGFAPCGRIFYDSGERLAFEKKIGL